MFYVENTTSTVHINMYGSFTLTAVIFIMYQFQYNRMMSNKLNKGEQNVEEKQQNKKFNVVDVTSNKFLLRVFSITHSQNSS